MYKETSAGEFERRSKERKSSPNQRRINITLKSTNLYSYMKL
jgi:hypothetical protein